MDPETGDIVCPTFSHALFDFGQEIAIDPGEDEIYVKETKYDAKTPTETLENALALHYLK